MLKDLNANTVGKINGGVVIVEPNLTFAADRITVTQALKVSMLKKYNLIASTLPDNYATNLVI